LTQEFTSHTLNYETPAHILFMCSSYN